MTRKHFEAIAAIIKARVTEIQESEEAAEGFDQGFDAGSMTTLEDVANDLANFFVGENALFDEARFLKACGL